VTFTGSVECANQESIAYYLKALVARLWSRFRLRLRVLLWILVQNFGVTCLDKGRLFMSVKTLLFSIQLNEKTGWRNNSAFPSVRRSSPLSQTVFLYKHSIWASPLQRLACWSRWRPQFTHEAKKTTNDGTFFFADIIARYSTGTSKYLH